MTLYEKLAELEEQGIRSRCTPIIFDEDEEALYIVLETSIKGTLILESQLISTETSEHRAVELLDSTYERLRKKVEEFHKDEVLAELETLKKKCENLVVKTED